MIDLHIHTTFSDGSLSPKEVVRYASKKKLKAIAITDHDTVSGIEEATVEGCLLGVETIPGIELSTELEDIPIHIIGLLIDTKSKSINERFTRALERKYLQTISILIENGYRNLSFCEFKENFQITRHDFELYLISKKIARCSKELKTSFIGRGAVAYVSLRNLLDKITPNEAISMIKEAGGISVWAHPFEGKGNGILDYGQVDYIAFLLKKKGIEGIESHYPTHSTADFSFIQNVADKYKLVCSGGSDFHRDGYHGILGEGCIGKHIPYALLSEMRKKIQMEGDS